METSYHQKRSQSRPVTETVRAVDELHIWGPITPTAWRQHPIFRRVPTPAQQKKGESGTVNHCAIDVLADIMRWYRIKRTVDEHTGQVISEERLFSGEALQKDYQRWADELGWTKRQVQDAVKLLHDTGVIKRWCSVMISSFGIPVGNAVFLEPNVEKVREISRPVVSDDGNSDPVTHT